MKAHERGPGLRAVRPGPEWMVAEGRSPRVRESRPGVLVSSAESLDDPLHLVVIVGAKRRGPEVATRAELEQHCGGALVVGGFGPLLPSIPGRA